MTSEPDIDSLRDEIDRLDGQMLELFLRRVSIVREIGRYKHARGLPVYDAERERAIIQRLTEAAAASLDPQVVRRVFERIIDESRGIEHHSVEQKSG